MVHTVELFNVRTSINSDPGGDNETHRFTSILRLPRAFRINNLFIFVEEKAIFPCVGRENSIVIRRAIIETVFRFFYKLQFIYYIHVKWYSNGLFYYGRRPKLFILPLWSFLEMKQL